jgi:hypothetical protein
MMKNPSMSSGLLVTIQLADAECTGQRTSGAKRKALRIADYLWQQNIDADSRPKLPR